MDDQFFKQSYPDYDIEQIGAVYLVSYHGEKVGVVATIEAAMKIADLHFQEQR